MANHEKSVERMNLVIIRAPSKEIDPLTKSNHFELQVDSEEDSVDV